jgi:hypothetical protein
MNTRNELDRLLRTVLCASEAENTIVGINNDGFAKHLVHTQHIVPTGVYTVSAADAMVVVYFFNSHISFLRF